MMSTKIKEIVVVFQRFVTMVAASLIGGLLGKPPLVLVQFQSHLTVNPFPAIFPPVFTLILYNPVCAVR